MKIPSRLTRREFGLALTAAAVGASTLPSALFAEDDLPWVTEVPALAPLVSNLQYEAESPKPEQRCTGCVLYTAIDDERGRCSAFQNAAVHAGGWCLSWAPRPS